MDSGDKLLYRHFGGAVATWCSYKVPTMSRRRPSMAAVPGHDSPTSALQGTILLTMTLQDQRNAPHAVKHTSIYWTVESLCMDSS